MLLILGTCHVRHIAGHRFFNALKVYIRAQVNCRHLETEMFGRYWSISTVDSLPIKP